MANNYQRHTDEILSFVSAFPAEVLTKVRPTGRGGFVATVDVGPQSYVSDADMPEYAATAQEACEKVKRHLLDDLACGGQWGKRHYQPHWDAYDVRYRLGRHWEEKRATMEAGAMSSAVTTDENNTSGHNQAKRASHPRM